VSTVGGLVTAVFGRVPRPGESVDYRGFAVEVIDAEGKRVNRVRFRRKAEAPPA
jgi:CBS domain containing-hemolysin-like protein